MLINHKVIVEYTPVFAREIPARNTNDTTQIPDTFHGGIRIRRENSRVAERGRPSAYIGERAERIRRSRPSFENSQSSHRNITQHADTKGDPTAQKTMTITQSFLYYFCLVISLRRSPSF